MSYWTRRKCARRVKIVFIHYDVREYFGRVDSAFKAPCTFLDASCTFWTRRVHFGRVVEISYYILMLFSTRRAHFRRVQKDTDL